MMRILHVITGLNVGGAEAMLARIIANSKRPDVTATVATLMAPGFVGGRMLESGIAVRSLGMTSIWTASIAMIRLVLHIRRTKPDLVMAWMHHAQLAATLAVRLSGLKIPVVWNVRHSLGEGFTHERRLTRAVLRMQAMLSRKPTAIIYNSRKAAQQYRAIGFNPRREHVIPNGFDVAAEITEAGGKRRIREIFGLPDNAILIGMVARSHPMKDVANLVAAFALLRSSRVNAHLLMVGEGMDKPTASVAAALARLPQGSWTLAGQRPDVATWLGGLDILVLPSAWGEGFSNIIGEAMAQAVPCVGTDVGDTAWIIGRTGRSVPPRNATALALALLELCGLPESERHALGLAARQRIVDMFALGTIVGRYEALVDELIGAGETACRPPRNLRCEAV